VDDSLHAGAARRTINPPLGIGKIGGRLFGDPMAYLPRADDQPDGGWRMDERDALPDWIPQFYPGQVTALHPDSEQRALEATLALIGTLT
jgi:hypothetical protein